MKLIYQSGALNAFESDADIIVEILADEDTVVEPSIFFRVLTIESDPIITIPIVPGEALVWVRQLMLAAGYSLDSINYGDVTPPLYEP